MTDQIDFTQDSQDNMGYRRLLKTGIVKSLQATFDGNYPDARLQNLLVSIEYPVKPQDYPSIWVNFEVSSLRNAGIDHYEVVDPTLRYLRWRFEGTASFTIVALTSLERDRIYDELIKVMAFTRTISVVGTETSNNFRTWVEDNPYIRMNFNFDEIESQGDNAAPGTPWQSDEIVYEISFGMEVLGEFVNEVDTGALVPLSAIDIQATSENDPTDITSWSITMNSTPGA